MVSLADWQADQQSALRGLCAGNLEKLKHYELEVLDRVAGQVYNWAVAYGGGVEAAAGAGGILLAVLGVLAVINISLRTIRKLDFATATRPPTILRSASSSTPSHSAGAAKLASAKVLREIRVVVARETFKSMAQKAAQDSMSKEAVVTAARATAKELGFQLTKKRILVSIPLVGGGVGLHGWQPPSPRRLRCGQKLSERMAYRPWPLALRVGLTHKPSTASAEAGWDWDHEVATRRPRVCPTFLKRPAITAGLAVVELTGDARPRHSGRPCGTP